jgi:branched-chain amino acid transport system ATP-binding protein
VIAGSDLVLQLDHISRRFGGLRAVDDISVQIRRGSIHSIIGPNGAGKTTLFNVVCGVLAPTDGTVTFNGANITGWHSDRVSRAGLARTFQATRLFRRLTVFENLTVAGWAARTRATGGEELGGRAQSMDEIHEEARAMLEFVGLAGTEKKTANALAYGQQRLLEIGRALMTKPSMLMMDEPAAGMSTRDHPGLVTLIRSALERYQLTVVLIEHAMSLVMEISDQITVLDHGVKIGEGSPSSVAASEAVIAAYLGVDDRTA